MLNLSNILSFNTYLLILSGALYSTQSFKSIALIVFALTILISLLLILICKANAVLDKKSFLIFLFSFLVMALSSIFNSAFELFFGAIFFISIFLIYNCFKVNFTAFELFDKPIKILFITITLLNFFYGVSFPFTGAFSNPNSLGGIYAMISIISSAVFLDKVNKKNSIDYYLVVILLLSLFFSLMSNSRMAFISSILSISSILIYFSFKSFSFKKIFVLRKYFFNKLISMFFLLFFILIFFWNTINEVFVRKFLFKLSESDTGVTDGRSDLWMSIIEHSEVLGHGRNSPHLDYFGYSAHNTFFSIYDQFGWLSCLFFVFGIFLLSLRVFYIKNIREYGFTPAFIVFGFIFLSISESLINKTIMLSFFMVSNIYIFKKVR